MSKICLIASESSNARQGIKTYTVDDDNLAAEVRKSESSNARQGIKTFYRLHRASIFLPHGQNHRMPVRALRQ